MHRLICWLIFAIILLPVSSALARIKIFACEPEWASLSALLGGEKVTVYSATNAQQNPHYIQARPSLIARLRNADLAVCTGAELEIGWMPMLQRRARNPKVLPDKPGYFAATNHVHMLEIPDRLDRSDGDVHAQGNPHIHLDPRRILQVAEALSNRLMTIDPGNALIYQDNWITFQQRWQKAMENWELLAKPLSEMQVVVHHREWIYLLDWLSLQRVGSLEPFPGVPPTLKHLTRLKELGKPDLIIASPLNDPKPALWFHQHADVPLIILPQTVGAVKNSDDLFSFFDRIVKRLLKIEG